MSHNDQQLTRGDEDSEFQMSDIFSTRKPRDAAAGASSGLKSIAKGVAGGVASLVALPIAKGKEEGAIGVAKGLGLGMLSAVTMTVAGVGTGLVQIGRGIANTPGAIAAKMEDKVWDEEKRIWYYYSLPEEADTVLKQVADGGYSVSKVKDMEYYDILGVASTADAKDIKKAYRQRAIVLHPDKNPDDPNASENFQRLGNAYQVLSNPQLRAAYDQKGKDGLDEKSLLDSSQLFEVIFGSQRFESYVGELQLLSMKDGLQALDEQDTEAQIKLMKQAERERSLKQKKRVVQAAVNLAKLLDQFGEDKSEDHVSFTTMISNEAKELSSTSFGGALIAVLGYVYEMEGINYLGFKHDFKAGMGVNSMAQSAHNMATNYRVLSSAIKVLSSAKKEKEKQEASKKKNSTDERAEVQNHQMDADTVGKMMETLWNITVVDVESMLKTACFKVLHDSSVTKEKRQLRAEALVTVGKIFAGHGKSSDDGLKELGLQFAQPQENEAPADSTEAK